MKIGERNIFKEGICILKIGIRFSGETNYYISTDAGKWQFLQILILSWKQRYPWYIFFSSDQEFCHIRFAKEYGNEAVSFHLSAVISISSSVSRFGSIEDILYLSMPCTFTSSLRKRQMILLSIFQNHQYLHLL